MKERTGRQRQTNRHRDGQMRNRNHELSRLEKKGDLGGGGRPLTSISWFDGDYQESFGRLAMMNSDLSER